MQKKFKGCTIQNVVWQNRFPCLAFDVLDGNGEAHTINIQNLNVKDQIADILSGTRKRAFLAHGMTDIDIFFDRYGQVVIDWSPCPGTAFCFELPSSELQKILNGRQAVFEQ